ncbi:MAG TPA: YqgE/AlgH family protein [Chromatiaceae bacterium]|nr:YqgE/AlgH family protein [Chromatiaceae bacterium]
MSVATDLTNHFLIAMPSLADPNFSRTVTYICEHTEEGAMGIVINRMTDLQLADILEQMDIEDIRPEAAEIPIYNGGPVQGERGFVLHTGEKRWDSTLPIADGISITTSRDILEAMAHGEGPSEFMLALGYAGWMASQLEAELADNAWLSGPADKQILFSTPSTDRWQAAASLLGVDMNLLSGSVGHA